jgi:dolichol-phosphate mannosyltransferase
MPKRRQSKLIPIEKNTMLYSIVIPAYNESKNIPDTIARLAPLLRDEGIPFQLIIVNDHSTDDTGEIVSQLRTDYPEIKPIDNQSPGGFGRAVRCGMDNVDGEAVTLVMADLSDGPQDVVNYYRKLEEGYDCVYGSRFTQGSRVSNYPPLKLVIQRVVNNMIRLMFWTPLNDMTNAFKAYRSYVIDDIGPLHAAHFNITIELSLSALIRDYRITQIPISWEGRTWGQSNLHLRAMGRRYLATLLKIWFERILIVDDLLLETISSKRNTDEKTESSRTKTDKTDNE